MAAPPADGKVAAMEAILAFGRKASKVKEPKKPGVLAASLKAPANNGLVFGSGRTENGGGAAPVQVAGLRRGVAKRTITRSAALPERPTSVGEVEWALLMSQAVREDRKDAIAQKWLLLAESQLRKASDGARAAADAWAAEAAARRAAEEAKSRAIVQQRAGSQGNGHGFFISGSWDGWVPHEMVYDHHRDKYTWSLQLGSTGSEAFRIRGGDGAEAGGGGGGEGRAGRSGWTIGEDPRDEAVAGMHYRVVLRLAQGGESVTWEPLGRHLGAPERRYWIAGTWDKWIPHEMSWDPARHCFHFFVRQSKTAKESFQIWVHGNRQLRYYPEQRDGSFRAGHALYGPDSFAHGRAWTIGAHPRDGAARGACYEVRLRPRPAPGARDAHSDGRVLDVDWARVSEVADHGDSDAVADRTKALQHYAKLLEEQRRRCGGAASEGAGSRGAVGSGAVRQCSDNGRPEVAERLARDLAAGGAAAGAAPAPPPRGETVAWLMIENLISEDEARLRQDRELKDARHARYGVGWTGEKVASSALLARRLGCNLRRDGMASVVMDGTSGVRIAPTLEPAAAVNLGYLAVALQVRLRDAREPFFSLDPAEPPDGGQADNDEQLREPPMLVKRYVPAWIAGTKAGEVMFQADYHLKELSMGECGQPILGMLSCQDLSENFGLEKQWNAREWFVIKDAEVKLTDDNVLMPCVTMGVEAREQVYVEGSGMEDAKVTRPDHPLVRYAEEFTENFDLIAERKSVVFHLRELARAAVLAKYLCDSSARLDDAWFDVADEDMAACPMEIPELWNERSHFQIRIEEGEILNAPSSSTPHLHGVYGGVEFGLDRLGIRAPPTGAGMAQVIPTAATRAPVGVVGAEAVKIGRSRVQLPAFAMIGAADRGIALGEDKAQGVDLDLSRFDLSAATSQATRVQASDASLAVGAAFWAALEGSEEGAPGGGAAAASGPLAEGERRLFGAVFNPSLSDRRAEGDLFVPPATSASYLRRLKALVHKEELLRERRRRAFCSEDFDIAHTGHLFPRSWTSSLEVARRSARPPATLEPRPEYLAPVEREMLREALPRGHVTFDRRTEDGVRCRTYRIGSLEVRSTQEHAGAEEIAAVFVVRPEVE